ncbi:MAG: DUF928 domain-containing protein [Cyanobacteria bacterium J06632_22]
MASLPLQRKTLLSTATFSLCLLATLPVKAAWATPSGPPLATAEHYSKQTFEPPNRGTPDAPATTGTRLFQPRREGTPGGPTTSTGTRSGSCLNDPSAVTAFTGLGPQFEVGLTRATRPEFVWHLPASSQSFPIEFRLLTLDDANRVILVHSEQLAYAAGFMTYQMPERLPALEPGRRYYWQVIVTCNPNRPSRSLVSTAQFEVISPSAEITQALTTANTNADRATIYANDGLWYDALALVVRAETDEEQQLRTRLLRDLAYEEANSETGNATFSDNLTRLADATD